MLTYTTNSPFRHRLASIHDCCLLALILPDRSSTLLLLSYLRCCLPLFHHHLRLHRVHRLAQTLSGWQRTSITKRRTHAGFLQPTFDTASLASRVDRSCHCASKDERGTRFQLAGRLPAPFIDSSSIQDCSARLFLIVIVQVLFKSRQPCFVGRIGIVLTQHALVRLPSDTLASSEIVRHLCTPASTAASGSS